MPRPGSGACPGAAGGASSMPVRNMRVIPARNKPRNGRKSFVSLKNRAILMPVAVKINAN
ncbi:hypothetical protein BG36_06715 [Aquamicrobium defluvii]|uniref:Uncharacterized protein n=1 Tax=Aquamicrobium defluvii TaxID=69279 RepID=A0A011T2V3_9HYPH|nr:hypothetical protein BG36_06715 [Aquamicrobium defluvii]EZQ14350.1 hypothetical protein CF98_20380 [Halopseudomonas bauzanensis]